ncbi:MAG: nucleotide exchange factor GrpE [Verrucomicrobia bacterium]|nr:nucleotide exchange factor GrpE [Cytophagales bacterium]
MLEKEIAGKDNEIAQFIQQSEELNKTIDDLKAQSANQQSEISEQKDKYLRLYADFENFRKRVARERIELIDTANEHLMQAIVPIIDDFERAMKVMQTSSEKEGIQLIYNKLYRSLEQKGLKPMEVIGHVFDLDLHEAITQVPAPTEDMKGKVIDEVEKGYFLGEKVIRFAKVVIGN